MNPTDLMKEAMRIAGSRYLYRLNQRAPQRWCLLTGDCDRLAIALGAQFHSFGSVRSNTLRSIESITAEVKPECGVEITRQDTWKAALYYERSLAELYPGASEEKLREMGFGDGIDSAKAARQALSEAGELAPDGLPWIEREPNKPAAPHSENGWQYHYAR